MGFPQFGLTVVEAAGFAYRKAAREGAASVEAGRLLHALVMHRLPVKMPLFWQAAVEIDGAVRKLSGSDEPGALANSREIFSESDWKLQTLLHDVRRNSRLPGRSSHPEWSAGTRRVLARTLEEATERGVRNAHSGHLLAAALAVEDTSVQQMLAQADVSVSDARRQVLALAQLDDDGIPMTPGVQNLQVLGAVRPERLLPRALLRVLNIVIARHLKINTAMVIALGMESIRQASGYSAPQVTSAHLMLAILALEQQLSLAGQEVRPSARWANQAAAILSSHGVDYFEALAVVSTTASTSDGRNGESKHFPFPNRAASDPRWTMELASALDLAHEMASQHGHQIIGDTHLLAAVLSSDDSVASLALANLQVDPSAVRRSATEALRQ